MATKSHGIFEAARGILERAPLGGAGKLLQTFLLPEELERAWFQATEAVEKTKAAVSSRESAIFDAFLSELEVKYECAAVDLGRVASKGALVLVANHPFGLVEGAILGALLARVRPDFKILANSLLAEIPSLRDFLILVDPFGGAAKANWRSLRASLDWLNRGGMLVTFPAGEVSSFQFPKFQISDPEWNANVSRLIQMSGAVSLPAYIHGANGPGFQIAGMIHPRLRTALLPIELLNKRGQTIRVSIGRPIGPERFAQLPNDREATDYLWHRTHALEARDSRKPWNFQTWPMQPWSIGPRRAPIAGASDPAAMRAEADRLEPLLQSGEFAVYSATAEEIPHTLHEIGRLREIAFRQAGEGTGNALDLDRFDAHYLHLWIWNTKSSEVVGAYRMAGTDTVERMRDLYTSTLFRFRPGLLESFHPALELGRSFVRPEYQRSYVALLLLWKGIGRYVARNPRYRVLFGPVSISREYNSASRSVMVSYLKARCGNAELEALVEPKRRFSSRPLGGCDTRLLGSLLSNVDELSDVVADLEPDGKGVPVLLRQYLNLGGRILAFNVDAAFSDVLDGLVVVDLARMNRNLLDRYLGKAGAAAFLEKQNM